MKIIKHGSPKHNKPDRKFKCDYCGCVFTAKYGEYVENYEEYKGTIYTCNCPECNNKCYTFEVNKNV